jgi:PadR family transcriptional regulator PadR
LWIDNSDQREKQNKVIFITEGHKMKIENTKAQMRKGVLEYCILLVLDGKPLYASDIIQSLKEAKMIVVEGTLYPLLTRLKNSGLLAYRWEESTQGPPRKYYELTETGRSFLVELEDSWGELVDAVDKIKTNKA